jgi:hypothetical protein
MKKIAVFFISGLSLLMFSCASQAPKPTVAPSAGGRRIAMEARVQVQDKAEKKTYTLMLEAVAMSPSRLRMDLTGGFGSPMGKLVMRGEQVGILIPQQKKAYIGTVSENAFKPLLPLEVSPRDLMNFLFGEVPKTWFCEKKTAELETCTDPAKHLSLERNPASQQAKWTLTGEKFALAVLPTSVKTNVQLKPDTFSMPIPDNYSRHKLP